MRTARQIALGMGWALLLVSCFYRCCLNWNLPILDYIWYLPGMVFLPLGLLVGAIHLGSRSRKGALLALLALWLSVGLLAGWRWSFDHAGAERPILRVATANMGSYATDLKVAAASLASHDLDVILFQEIWNMEHLKVVQHEFPGYRFVRGGRLMEGGYFEFGTFIATRLGALDVPSPVLNHAMALRLRWENLSIAFVCLHGLKTADDKSMAFSYGPRDFSRMAERQREQTEDVLDYLREISTPAIVGGDFNAPPSAPSVRLLRGDLNDSFQSSGRGLGLTFPADFPVLRIDQILFSPELVARGYDTIHLGSDHLAVISEFQRAER